MPPRFVIRHKFGGYMSKIKQLCEERLGGVIKELGYELVSVDYVKESGGMSLIFTIDSENGVGIDDCEVVSKKIDPILEELNPTDDKTYTLVVSSPGLDRPLKTDRDLNRALGQEVEVTLFSKLNGKKNFVGTLENFTEKEITLKTDTAMTFERAKIANIKMVIKF